MKNLPDTARIPAGRFEQSPFYEFYANQNTLFGVAASRYYPADNGESKEATYYLECGIGYVRFHQAGDRVGRTLLMKTKQGELVDCEILALPFYDTQKRIPRGLPAVD